MRPLKAYQDGIGRRSWTQAFGECEVDVLGDDEVVTVLDVVK